MLDVVTSLAAVLERLPPLLALLVVVLLVAGETGVVIGLLFPVEVPLMFAGFLAFLGEVPFLVVLLMMIAAAMVGDALALRSGRRYGPRIRASRLGTRIGEGRWRRADELLRRLGGRSVFVARWVPFVRTLLPRLAGQAGMSYREFVGWNAAGVVTAVGSAVALGYWGGASYQRVATVFEELACLLLVCLALVVAAAVLVRRWRQSRAARRARPAESGSTPD